MTPEGGHLFDRPDEELGRIQAGLRQLADQYGMLRGLLDAVLAIGAELELEPVLHRIVEAGRGLVRARYGALGVLNEAGQFIEMISSGFCRDHSSARGEELPHGSGLLGDLVRDPRPLRVDDLATHPGAAGFPREHPVMTTLLGVPIRVRQAIYGNLYLADKAGGPFTAEDQEVVMALAGAAGMAIENARLYRRTCRATEDFQRRLLPEMPHLEGWELQARFQPSSRAPCIGGDWYDLIRLPDGVPCLVIGDVMGHDVQAAIVMSQISNMLRVIALDEQESPSRILRRLDRVLHWLHGGPMATVVVARLEQAAGSGRRLRWTSAGHLPPLLAVPGERARYLYADVGVPLGVDPDLPRTDNHVDLPGGAAVLLHTDGLVENRDHSIGQGMDQIAAVATTHAADPLARLCDALLAHPGGAFEDDVALLAVRPPA
ncbi:GAF domain-containing SpoIIE family protein phosphatase [Sphaerimonospora mesophila]|uniref:PP2C family protein-serine/threonine phosphatase n=1 Tax=Sphaerimonospora mesophila TaxID=37483 RepID=UPI000A5A6829